MTLYDNLPIHVRKRWYHLFITFLLPVARAAIYGIGGAKIIGTILQKFIAPMMIELIIFTIVFCWVFWRNGIPRLRNWFWRFDLEHETISLTNFWKKRISFTQAEITSYKETPPIITLLTQADYLKINWSVFSDKEKVIVFYQLIRWVPQMALPTNIQEAFTLWENQSDDINYLKNNPFQANSDRQSLRGPKIFSVVLFFFFTCAGISVFINDTSIDAILASLGLIVLGAVFSIITFPKPSTITLDSTGLKICHGNKEKAWSWNMINAIEFRISIRRRSPQIRIWTNEKSFKLPTAYLEDLNQFGQNLLHQAYAREIPYHIWEER